MSATLKRLSYRHDAIAEYMIAQPTATKAEIAAHFGITQAWLSQVLSSDLFQAYYRKMKGDYIDLRIMPMRDKLMGLADRAVDRLVEKIDTVEDVRIIKELAESALGRLGYGAQQPRGPSVVVNNFQGALTPAELDAARLRYREMQQRLAGDVVVPALEGELVERDLAQAGG